MAEDESQATSAHSAVVASRLAPRGRGRTYGVMLGLALGSLLTGVVVPFAIGERPTDPTAADTLVLQDPSGNGAPAPVGGNPSGQPLPGASSPSSGGALPGGSGGTTGSSTSGATGGTGAAGSTGTSGATTGSGGTARPSDPLTASDRGVTPTTVKLGVLIPDLSVLGPTGFTVKADDIRGKYQSAIDTVNESGGLNGRKILPVYRTVSVLDQNEMRQACLAFANDDKVFSVVAVGGFYGPAVACVTVETKTPLVAFDPQDADDYRNARGYYVTANQEGRRAAANLAATLSQQGLLEGRKFGVFYAGPPYDPVTVKGLLPALRALGANIVSIYKHGDNPSSDVPIAVQQFQRDGVDTVIQMTNWINSTQFVQTAQNQGAQFRYYASDTFGNTSDFAIQNMPESYWGTVGISTSRINEQRVGMAEPAIDRQCVQTYLSRPYAKKFDGNNRNDGNYYAATLTCTVIQLTADAARAAGSHLTRSGFAAAAQALPSKDYPAVGGPLSFGPGKTDGGDYHRLVKADKSCKCWLPVGPFFRDRY